MATAQEDDGPVCPICVDCFTIPKVLSCGHSYCLDCLKDYVGEDDVNNFLCAVCRQQINVPDDGIEAFPSNYALVKSAPVVTSKCQNHAKKDAECYCRKCQSVLCYRCLHLHHNDHDSFDLESEADQAVVNEEFSKRENIIRKSIDRLKTVSKTLSNTITTYSHDECKKVDDYTKQVIANIQQKAVRVKTLIRHKVRDKLSEVEKREDEIRAIAENAEIELVSVLSSTSNESFLTLVQNLPKLKQLNTKLKEEDIGLPKVEVFEWTPGNIEVPDDIGTIQIKPFLFTIPPSFKTEDPGDDMQFETEGQGDDLQVETEGQGDDLQFETEGQGDDLQVETEGQGDDLQVETECQGDDLLVETEGDGMQFETEGQGDGMQFETEGDGMQFETEDQGDDLQFETEDQGDDLQFETEDQCDYWQVDSSGVGYDEPDFQFSYYFGFDHKAAGYIMEHYSKDQFCVTALRKMVWSCYLTPLVNGVYVILLGEENKDIDHCVIDYRLSIPHTYSGEALVLKQGRNIRFDTDVPHGINHSLLLDLIPFDYPFQIIFDIIRIKEIVNKV